MMSIALVIQHITGTHSNWNESPLLWMMAFTLLDMLFSSRIQITHHALKQSCWFAQKFKLFTSSAYALDSIAHIEVSAPDQTYLCITSSDGKMQIIDLQGFSNREALVAELSQHISCEFTTNFVEKYDLHNLGNRAGRACAAAAVILVTTLIIAGAFMTRVTAHDHWTPWLLLIIPLTISVIHPWIKAEMKLNPRFTSFITGGLLGSALVFAIYVMLQLVLA